MAWGKKRIAGQVYDLTHLNPFQIQVTPKAQGAPTYNVLVSFGSHTFTRSLEPHHTPDLVFNDGREDRCFCIDRHGMSLHLPQIVRNAVGGRAYFSQTRNYLLSDQIPGGTDPYAVFFNMEKSKSKKHHVSMFVISAYEKPNLPKSLPKITFATLVSKIAREERVVRPRR